MEKDRVWYFDLLRIVASFGVMVLHVAAQNWKVTDVHSYEWQVFNVYDSIVRWTVPVFVMISGALLLESKQGMSKVPRRVLRIVTAFLFWSVLYAAVSYLQGASMEKAIKEVFKGHYHMWFLFMIAGLYLVSPFAEKMVEQERLIKYFLVLSVFFTILLPRSISALDVIYKPAGDIVKTMVNNVHFHMAMGYIGYYWVGHYLSKKEMGTKTKISIYLFSILGFVGTIVLTLLVSVHKGKADSQFYGNFTFGVLLESIGVFTIFRSCFEKINMGQRAGRIIARLSKYSFGAYLVHPLILEQLKRLFGFHSLSFHPAISVPVLSVVLFVLSYAVSGALNHIPGISKYIV